MAREEYRRCGGCWTAVAVPYFLDALLAVFHQPRGPSMNRPTLFLLLLTSLFLFGNTPVFSEDSDAEKAAKAKPKDRYQVPEGDDVAALVKFLDGLMAYRPKTTDEILAYRQKAQKTMGAAADKILELEKDETSAAYRKAVSIKLQLDLSKLRTGTKNDQQDFYERVAKHMDGGKTLGQPDLALAFTTSQLIENSGNAVNSPTDNPF